MDGIDLAKQRFIKIPPAIPQTYVQKCGFLNGLNHKNSGFTRKPLDERMDAHA
jgi:hypothetical protein